MWSFPCGRVVARRTAKLVSEMMRVRIASKLGSTHSWVSVIVKMDTLPRKGEPRYHIG